MFLFFLFLLISWINAQDMKPPGESTLPVPSISSITAFDGGFEVAWTPVASSNIDEPILGYKINVWEPDIQTVYKYDSVNGANMLVESAVPLDPNIFDNAPRRPPQFSVVTRDTVARFNRVKPGMFYEIRVQALTGREMGAMSVATSVKLHLPERNKKPDSYQLGLTSMQ